MRNRFVAGNPRCRHSASRLTVVAAIEAIGRLYYVRTMRPGFQDGISNPQPIDALDLSRRSPNTSRAAAVSKRRPFTGRRWRSGSR